MGLRGAGHRILIVVRQQLFGVLRKIAVARLEHTDEDLFCSACGDKIFQLFLPFLAFSVCVGAVHCRQPLFLIHRISHFSITPVLL